VADGGTATTVSTAANGHQTVTLALATAGVSTNTYSQFNVGKAGVDLDNNGVNARNIVNQVTSTNPSLIEGALRVLGPRANVIIANPNGITVNGGAFINTGNVALTTGGVSFSDYVVAGQPQRNILLSTNQGTIEIGPDGLAGAMLNLELIAKNVKVNGPVVNSFSNVNSGIRVVAGDSAAQIDGAVSPTDNLTPWIGYSSPNTSNPNVIAVDITPLGSLTAGKIQLVVTDQGAAVKHAGVMYANVGDFVISSTGDLQIAGGHIQAAGNVIVATNGFHADSGMNGQANIQAANTIDVRSPAISVANTQFDAGGNILLGIDGQATTAGTTISNSTFHAAGGIGIYNHDNAVSMTGSVVIANQNLLLSAQSANLSTQWSDNTAQSTLLTSQAGVVDLTLNNDLTLTGAKVNGTAGSNVTAGSLILAASHSADGSASDRALLESIGAGVAIQTTNATKVIGSDILAAFDVAINSAGFSSLNDGTSGSTVVAVNGSVVVHSSTDITNIGSLIQGTTRNAGNPQSQGAVTLNAGGNILNESPSETLLGAIFGKSDDVVLTATGNITNHHARILTNKALTLQAQGDVQNFVDKQSGSNNEQPQVMQSQGTRWLIFTQNTSSFDVDYGKVGMPSQLAYLVAGTDMTIKGNNVINRGGELDANNGNIRIMAANQFQNQALFDGSAHFSSKCLFVCHMSASSNITSHGGLISASGDIDITAGVQASNIGGRVLALNDLTVTAPKTYATGVMGYTTYERNSGFKAWFGDTWARLYAADVGGTWTANSGKTSINGQAIVDGGTFNGATGVNATGGIVVQQAPILAPVSIENHLGMTTWLWK
jgi:filamentous hemagglutinin family protein